MAQRVCPLIAWFDNEIYAFPFSGRKSSYAMGQASVWIPLSDVIYCSCRFLRKCCMKNKWAKQCRKWAR